MGSASRRGLKHGEKISQARSIQHYPNGIVHKPTDAAFTPHPGDPFSGIGRLGQLGNKGPNGCAYRPEDVQRMLRELWAEYVASNQHLFKL